MAALTVFDTGCIVKDFGKIMITSFGGIGCLRWTIDSVAPNSNDN